MENDKKVIELYNDDADAAFAMLRYIYTNTYRIAGITVSLPQVYLKVCIVARSRCPICAALQAFRQEHPHHYIGTKRTI